MSKVTRANLSRGVALQADHVFDVLEDIRDELNNSTVSKEQLETGRGSFRVDLPMTFIDSLYIENGVARNDEATNGVAVYSIPFMLPVTQDTWPSGWTAGTVPILGNDVPIPVLEELHFSIDTKAEGGAISDQYYLSAAGAPAVSLGEAGRVHYGEVDRYTFKVSLLSKQPLIYGTQTTAAYRNIANWRAMDEVFSLDIDASAYSGDKLRLNPFVATGINRQCDPRKTYIVAIRADGLFDADDPTHRLALVSPKVSLRFSIALMPRDTNDDKVAGPAGTGSTTVSGTIGVQNMPVVHQGRKLTGTVSIGSPGPNDDILADGVNGVNTNLTTIDQELRRGLGGGYTQHGYNYGYWGQIEDDACYGVIAVPMWSNQQGGEVNYDTIDHVAGNGGAAYTNAIMDRRTVRISYPFTIQHVMAAVNYQSYKNPKISPEMPEAGPNIELSHFVGVGLRQGLMADDYTYEQVAGLGWDLDLSGTGTVHFTHLIDRFCDPGFLGSIIPTAPAAMANAEDWLAWELMHIPLVYDAAPNQGVGHNTNGYPFFVAENIGAHSIIGNSRTVVGTGITGVAAGNRAPNTIGAEQALEVRRLMTPRAGGFQQIGSAGNLADAVYMGYGGAWVFLFVKRHLTGGGGL